MNIHAQPCSSDLLPLSLSQIKQIQKLAHIIGFIAEDPSSPLLLLLLHSMSIAYSVSYILSSSRHTQISPTVSRKNTSSGARG